MIRDLFLNFSLFIFFLFGFHRLQNVLRLKFPYKYQIVVGMIHGIFGIILILFGIRVFENNILDFRQLAIISAVYFGGFRAAIMTGMIIVAFRMSYFGINEGSIFAFITITINVIMSGFISKYVKNYWFKWINMILCVMILSSSFFVYQFIKNSYPLYPIMLICESFVLIGGLLIAVFISFLNRNEEIKVALKESEERYRTLIETSPDGIFVHKNGIIMLANDKAGTLLGTDTSKDLIGLNIFQLLSNLKSRSFDSFEKFSQSLERIVLEDSKFTRLDGKGIDLSFSESNIIYESTEATMVVFRDISEEKNIERKLQQANKLLHQLSISDGLTGIPNRRYFEEMYKLKWDEALGSQKPLSLIIFDIDCFKIFNDSYGHLEGDKCLKIVANTVSKIIESTSDFCARFGGEEFIGICDTDENGANELAEKIRKSVLDLKIPNVNSGVNQFVTISVGVVSLVPNISIEREAAIDYADKALYSAKLNGRNQVHFYQIDHEIFAK